MVGRLGTALVAAVVAVTVAGCGGSSGGSSEQASGGSSQGSSEGAAGAAEETPAPEADGGGTPSVDELAADIEAAGDGSGTPEDYRCLARVMIDNEVPADKVEAILGDDPDSMGDAEAMKLLDRLGPDLAKCYGAGG